MSAEPVAGRKDRKAVAVSCDTANRPASYIYMEQKSLLLCERILRALGRADIIMESLILAQNERWRRVLSMQVGRQAPLGEPRAADW